MGNNATGQEIKGGTLLGMFLRIRDEEIKNARTGQFDDEKMARRIANIIFSMTKDSVEKSEGGDGE